MHPKTDGILESSLYVSDVARSIRFYEELFGFRVIKDFGERGCAMDAGARHVLLLFKKRASRAITTLTMGTANCTWHSQFLLPNWRNGSDGSTREELRWRRNIRGKRAARASIFETRITTCSK